MTMLFAFSVAVAVLALLVWLIRHRAGEPVVWKEHRAGDRQVCARCAGPVGPVAWTRIEDRSRRCYCQNCGPLLAAVEDRDSVRPGA